MARYSFFLSIFRIIGRFGDCLVIDSRVFLCDSKQ